jgi:(R,R)-butanediol dehydrogenase/meso-butanediol dehydrogenase/diacetyl reductase
MGHEITGIVEEIGENISHVKVGDRVICVNVSLDVSQGQLRGMGMFQNGGFAEYVNVPEISLFPIPENVSNKDAIMVETFALMMRAFKLSRIEKGEKVLIIGGGNVGLAALKSVLIEKNPEYVVVVEPNEFLRKKAIAMGATDAVGKSRAKVKRVTKKLGSPTFIFDCVANEETLSNAINFIEKGGTILLEGIHKGSITFPLFMLNSKEVTLKGCLGHDEDDIKNAIDLFAKGKVDANEFISEIIKLEDMQKTFERFIESDDRNFIKILVEP